MKKIYISIIAITVIILALLISLSILKIISLEQMLMLLATMNAIAIIGVGTDKLCFQVKQTTEKKKAPNEEEQTETEVIQMQDIVDTTPTENVWSKSMYELYINRWNELFEGISYPIDKKNKSEINVLCWEIASKTIDYLLVYNEDANLLERNKDSVNAVIAKRKLTDQNLKEYFKDPSTVPAKVIGVYDALSSQLTDNQKFSTQIFGYLVEISSDNE